MMRTSGSKIDNIKVQVAFKSEEGKMKFLNIMDH